jgi:rhamnulokinase
VPAAGEGWAYLSSGTWSLIGVESKEPLINEEARAANFTNEIGFGGTIRFLKNLVGLWIVQECRRHWARVDREYSYGELTRLAMEAPPLRSLIEPDDLRFVRPEDMPAKVQEFCRDTAQPVPETPGQIIRCVLESLALLYRRSLDQLERLTGRALHTLHIVGGGSCNELLNQFTANATGRRVIAGPVEATAIGNLLVQAIAMQHLDSLAALRGVVRDSFDVATFDPVERNVWENAYEKFSKGAA